MVFGYYHITMRSFSQQEIPSIQLPPGAKIVQKVKVGHILWVPFIPLGKVWVLELGNKMMKLDYQTINTLEQKFGTKSAPWYAFAGFIAIAVIGVGMNMSQKAKSKAYKLRAETRFEETLASRLDKVDNPQRSDIFFFKGDNNKKIALKVNRSNTDSVYFLAPLDNENKHWNRNNWAAGFYGGKNSVKEVAISKEELKMSFPKKRRESMAKKGMMVVELPIAGPFQLEKIQTIKAGDNVPVVDAAEMNRVKEGFNDFLKHSSNLDSLLLLIDKKSINYYKDQLKLAAKDDDIIVKKIRKDARIDDCRYELLLYTRYVYLKLEASPQLVKKKAVGAVITDEKLKDYLFFLKLMERGLLQLEGAIFDGVKIQSVSIPEKYHAQIQLSMPSNILISKKNIGFTVKMNWEEGRWKLNLPSSYRYTQSQVQNGYGYITEKSAQWREMIRKSVRELSKGKVIHSAWNY